MGISGTWRCFKAGARQIKWSKFPSKEGHLTEVIRLWQIHFGKSIVRLVKPTSGKIIFKEYASDDPHGKRFCKSVQMVFQDPKN